MKSHKIASVMSKIISGGLLPRPSWRSSTTLLQSSGNSLTRRLLNAFGVSFRRLWRLKSNVSIPKQFSGSAPCSVFFTFSAEIDLDQVCDLSADQKCLKPGRRPARSVSSPRCLVKADLIAPVKSASIGLRQFLHFSWSETGFNLSKMGVLNWTVQTSRQPKMSETWSETC